MRDTVKIILCALLAVLFWTSGAGASAFHHKDHKEKKSPALESEQARHACPLNHHQKGLPCPHAAKHKTMDQFFLGPDCGGGPLASIPAAVSFSKNHFSVSESSSIEGNDEAESVIQLFPRYQFSLLLQLDHPPQSL